jgi:hypothetical protein
MEVADFQPNITLPASGDCYGITVLSKKETRLPRAECDEIKKRAIFIDSENYKLLRKSIQKNCQNFQCKEIIGAFDGLFLAIDEALQLIPGGF